MQFGMLFQRKTFRQCLISYAALQGTCEAKSEPAMPHSLCCFTKQLQLNTAQRSHNFFSNWTTSQSLIIRLKNSGQLRSLQTRQKQAKTHMCTHTHKPTQRGKEQKLKNSRIRHISWKEKSQCLLTGSGLTLSLTYLPAELFSSQSKRPR